MELKKHTEEAASRVEAVLQRAEEQGQMIESLHTSVSPSALSAEQALMFLLFLSLVVFFCPVFCVYLLMRMK